MFFKTEFRLKPMEDAVSHEAALGVLKDVIWVREAAWGEGGLIIGYDPGRTNPLQLIEIIKNTGYEVLSMGPTVEIIEALDQAS